jgi:hypothetical protein
MLVTQIAMVEAVQNNTESPGMGKPQFALHGQHLLSARPGP